MSPKRIAIAAVGAVLIVVGIAALVLPGPGLLLILVGLIVLSTEFEWAEKRVDYMRGKALVAAAAGVETWPRIVFSTLSALAVIGVGVVWGLDPEIPEVGVLGPHLPLAGWTTGGSIIAGGIIALGLLIYSVKRFRFGDERAPAEQRQRA